MSEVEVFQDERELGRLAVQNRLLAAYEKPVLMRLMSGRSGLKVLDVGCNDGRKTAAWFSHKNIQRVIGLEYHEKLALKARQLYGDEKFLFFSHNVENGDFPRWLGDLMEQTQTEAFDLIYLSFVLMHLQNPAELLRRLRSVLAPGGRIMVVEANDPVSRLEPDPDRLLDGFLKLLSRDPYGGKRDCGAALPELLEACGYRDICMEHTAIAAGKAERKKKEDIFETFFSYLPQDLAVLRQKYPENILFRDGSSWMESHYENLRKEILSENAVISMGVGIVTASGEQ